MLNIEEEQHAYLYGFALADGTLREQDRNRGCLAIEVQHRDYEIVVELCTLVLELGYMPRVCKRSRVTNFGPIQSVSMRVFALEFRSQLKALGFPIEKKHKLAVMPAGAHPLGFWRGYIDGNGSIGVTNKGLPFISLTTPSDAIAISFADFLEPIIGYHKTINPNRRDRVYNVMLTKEAAVATVERLYTDAEIALPRKLAAAMNIMTWQRPAGMRRSLRHERWSSDDLQFLGAHDLAECIAHFGSTRTATAIMLKRNRVLRSQSQQELE